MKSLVCLIFVIFSYSNIYSQNILLNIHWSRIEYDSLKNPIDENKNHFDMHSFSFNSKDSLIYWPIADCYSFAGSLCPFIFHPTLNEIKIDFYRNYYSLLDSTFHKKQYTRTYHYELIQKNSYTDSNSFDFEFANRFNLTRIYYVLQLKDITDGTIIKYQGMMYKRDAAFKKMQRKIGKRSRKRNQGSQRMKRKYKNYLNFN